MKSNDDLIFGYIEGTSNGWETTYESEEVEKALNYRTDELSAVIRERIAKQVFHNKNIKNWTPYTIMSMVNDVVDTTISELNKDNDSKDIPSTVKGNMKWGKDGKLVFEEDPNGSWSITKLPEKAV